MNELKFEKKQKNKTNKDKRLITWDWRRNMAGFLNVFLRSQHSPIPLANVE